MVLKLGADVLAEGAGHILGSELFFVARFKLQEVKHDLVVEVLVCFDQTHVVDLLLAIC